MYNDCQSDRTKTLLNLSFKASTLPQAGICFSVVPSSNPRSRFINSQLVCLLPVGIFNYICYVYLKYLFPLFQWHAYKLANSHESYSQFHRSSTYQSVSMDQSYTNTQVVESQSHRQKKVSEILTKFRDNKERPWDEIRLYHCSFKLISFLK